MTKEKSSELKDGISLSKKQLKEIEKIEEKNALLLKQSISDESEVIADILDQKTQFDSFANHMSGTLDAIDEINAHIHKVKNAVDEVDDEAHLISIASKHIADSVHKVAGIVNDRISVTTELCDDVKIESGKVSKVSSAIQTLSSNITQIKNVISSMNEIEERADLLISNAQEKQDFQTAADEIKKLSESAKDGALSVGKVLRSLIETLSEVEKGAKDADETMQHVSAKVNETTESLNQIAAEMQDISFAGDELFSSVKTISDSADNLQSKFASVSDEIDKIADSAKTGERSFDSLMNDSRKIKSLMCDEIFRTNEIIDNAITTNNILALGSELAEGTRRFSFVNIALKHLSWITKARACVDGKLSGKDAALSDSTACELGKWIASFENKPLSDRQEFIKLAEEHKSLHEIAADIFESSRKTDQDELEKKYGEILKKSDSVIKTMWSLKTAITFSQNL